ncbi:hypothetical protein FSARC_4023 [Fusarium sarcochroum]|uniref:Chromo domain-containing protein n=1 Tax=Fusarium sarcochroum TaxID=1208366 RepID=A0A8H4XBZ3_9HYPO|nr:hypothetical protein FSARC_4023 [Fusarium sarcochroum]
MPQKETYSIPPSSSLSDEDADDEDFPFEDARETRIDRHNIHRKTSEVTFWMRYKFAAKGAWFFGWFEEGDVQDRRPELVLDYWTKLGGRCEVTKLKTFRVLRILSEDASKYRIQWIGYDTEKDATMEPKKKINDICPGAVLEWESRDEE